MYVDDLLIIAPLKQSVQTIKDLLNYQFAIKDLGPVGYFLGIYVNKILKDFNYEEYRLVSTLIKKGKVLEPAPKGY